MADQVRATLDGVEQLSPEMIEACRIDPTSAMIHRQQLTELALDGLRFRAWCEGASTFSTPGISELAKLLAKCIKPHEYREAIDKFIVMRAKCLQT